MIITFEPKSYTYHAQIKAVKDRDGQTINAFDQSSITFKSWPKEIQDEYLAKHCTGQKYPLEKGGEAYAVPYYSTIYKSIDDQFNKWERENTPNIEIISLHYAVGASNEYEIKSLIVQYKKVSKN